MHVAPSAVTTRARTIDQADAFEDIEMVGQEVRFDAHEAPQLHRRPIGKCQLVDDRQPHRITQGGMTSST